MYSSFRIQESLLHALNSHQTNWPTLIQNHALSLLRSGEVSSYPDLLRRVLEDIRNDSMSKTAASANGDNKKVNGNSDKTSLAIPDSVIEDALRVTRESLEAVCEVEDTTST